MPERTPGVRGQGLSIREHIDASMPDALDSAHQPIQSVLAGVWEFAASSPDITDEQRGVLAQVLTRYVASEPPLPASTTTEADDIVDATEATAILGYLSDRGVRYVVETGKLTPIHERLTPSGRRVMRFLRADVERVRDERRVNRPR